MPRKGGGGGVGGLICEDKEGNPYVGGCGGLPCIASLGGGGGGGGGAGGGGGGGGICVLGDLCLDSA